MQGLKCPPPSHACESASELACEHRRACANKQVRGVASTCLHKAHQRGPDGTTALRALAARRQTKAPHAFQLPQLLRDLRAAAKVNIEALQQELRALHGSVRQGQAFLESLDSAAAVAEGVGVGEGARGKAGGREDVEVMRRFLEVTARELAAAGASACVGI